MKTVRKIRKCYIYTRELKKICDECTALGAELPRYEILGTGIRVYFPALKSALIDQPKIPNRQSGGLSGGIDGGLEERIIELIRADNTITVSEMAESLDIPKRTIEREIKKLRDNNSIIRKGGNRYGCWIIKQED